MTDLELNEAVAVGLGWNKHPDGQWNKSHPSGGEVVMWEGLPDYCHEIDAAWEVVEFLRQKPLDVDIEIFAGDILYTVTITRYDGPNEEVQLGDAQAATAPMAICLAFLKMKDK